MIETDKPGAGAGPGAGDPGSLTRRVLEYSAAIERLVPEVKTPADWAGLGEFIAVDDFERTGTFLEVQDFGQYAEMLTGWASATDTFETSVRQITEVPGLVYYEIEERHFAGGGVHTVNTLTVFQFNDDAKISRIRVYLQQAPQ
jgi:hypothetical protein